MKNVSGGKTQTFQSIGILSDVKECCLSSYALSNSASTFFHGKRGDLNLLGIRSKFRGGLIFECGLGRPYWGEIKVTDCSLEILASFEQRKRIK